MSSFPPTSRRLIPFCSGRPRRSGVIVVWEYPESISMRISAGGMELEVGSRVVPLKMD